MYQKSLYSVIGLISLFLSGTASAETHQAFEPEMVKIKGGCFQMGSPNTELERDDNERQHEVCLKNFEIGKYEVTQAQWYAVMRNNPSDLKKYDFPVESVSWNDIQQFIIKLNQMTSKAYRLPTEAEWEYAARAGTTTPFYTGNCITTAQANYDGHYDYANCDVRTGILKARADVVGTHPANPWGLYDMAGNVWEWTCSAYSKGYNGSEQKCSNGNFNARHVLRGGATSTPQQLRSANRYNDKPDYRFMYLGFRLSR
jgi:formylglycine-generating enzyme required for sulfatase activity